MGEFLSYSILSGLLMLAMYMAYRLFLARDNQHGFNRAVLLSIYLVSFMASPFIFSLDTLNVSTNPQAFTLEGIEVVETEGAVLSKQIWGTVLIWLLLAGMAAVTIKTIITWIRLTNVIRKGEKIRHAGYTLVVTDDERFAPFSWMRYVVISRSDYDNNSSAIATHELKHVACRHWIDLLIAQIICIINWFNPVAWLMRDELMLVHEYQADMAVIDSGHDTQEYQMLLIKKAVGARFPSLANSLNHSKLKKRITMMYKEKSGAGRKFKALALVPMLALALGVAGAPAVRAAVSTISSSDVSVSKDSENPPENKTAVQTYKVTDINNDGNETTVTIKGEGFGTNLTVSDATFTNRGKTYKANSLDCNMTDGIATIRATFRFSDELKKPGMTLMVNSKEVPFDLENFKNTAQAVVIGNSGNSTISSRSGVIVINGTSSAIPSGVSVYLDGKKISEAEMAALSSENISSISVDKQNNTIRISSKANNGNIMSKLGNMPVYVDGKEISEAEMSALPVENIASITVDKQNNVLRITTTK